MHANKAQLIDSIKRNIDRFCSSNMSYQEIPIVEQYVIIQQNEEIIELLKKLNAK